MEILHEQRLEQARFDFTQCVEAHFSPEVQVFILNAYDLAKHFHAKDAYGGGSYETHILGVANKCMMDMGLVRDHDAPTIAAALLHDTVEKHREELIAFSNLHVDLHDPHRAIVELTESNSVAGIVLGATNTPKGQLFIPSPYNIRSTGYHGDLGLRLLDLRTPASTTFVKTADVEYNVENLHSIPAETEELQQVKINNGIIKYWQCVPILREAHAQRVAGNEEFTPEQQQSLADRINRVEITVAEAGVLQAELVPLEDRQEAAA